MAARTGSAPASLTTRDQAATALSFAHGGEGGDEASGARFGTCGAGDWAVGLAEWAQDFEARSTILATIFVKWHWQTS